MCNIKQMQQDVAYPVTPSLLWSLYKHSCFTSTILTHSRLDFMCNSHFTGCEFWSIHSISFFYQFVEFGVHRHAGIGTISCIRWRATVTDLKYRRQSAILNNTEHVTYLVRRVPTAKCHRTKHRSQMCTHTQRYFQGTSIWPVDEPAWTKTEQWVDRQELKHVESLQRSYRAGKEEPNVAA